MTQALVEVDDSHATVEILWITLCENEFLELINIYRKEVGVHVRIAMFCFLLGKMHARGTHKKLRREKSMELNDTYQNA